jgi:hypothetical protein
VIMFAAVELILGNTKIENRALDFELPVQYNDTEVRKSSYIGFATTR